MKLVLAPHIYPELTQPHGFLLRDMACQACWRYYTLAEQCYLTVGEGPSTQIILDDMPWMDKHYESIARAVVMQYGLNSPDDWQRYWPLVAKQANALGYPAPRKEYMNRPRFSLIT